PSISVSAEQAQVGDTLRIIIENPQELIEEYGDVDYEFNAIGQFFDVNGTAGFFENTGIEVAENPYTFEYQVPSSIETDAGNLNVEPGAAFRFLGEIILHPNDEENREEIISFWSFVEIVGDTDA